MRLGGVKLEREAGVHQSSSTPYTHGDRGASATQRKGPNLTSGREGREGVGPVRGGFLEEVTLIPLEARGGISTLPHT